MAKQKTIAIVGATGAQGGGLVRAIFNDPDGEFVARAITRNATSPKAEELAELAAEVVVADLDDEDSLDDAFTGAHGAFCVTNFWEHFSPEKETEQAKAMARAARRAKLKHVIWSTLEDTRRRVPLDDDRMPTLMKKYKVPHFDGKGAADHVFTDLDVPTTYLLASFYWDNLIHFGMGPKPGTDGVLELALPLESKQLPGIAAEDIGGCALGIFKAGRRYIGKRVGIAGEHLTGSQLAAGLTHALGRKVRYRPVSPAAYRGFGFPGADDLGNMFQFQLDFQDEFVKQRDVALSRRLNPSLQTFEVWLAENKHLIPLR